MEKQKEPVHWVQMTEGRRNIIHQLLSEVYPILFIDAVHYSVRDNGVIRKLAAYVILGIKEAIAAAFPNTEYQCCIVH